MLVENNQIQNCSSEIFSLATKHCDFCHRATRMNQMGDKSQGLERKQQMWRQRSEASTKCRYRLQGEVVIMALINIP